MTTIFAFVVIYFTLWGITGKEIQFQNKTDIIHLDGFSIFNKTNYNHSVGPIISTSFVGGMATYIDPISKMEYYYTYWNNGGYSAGIIVSDIFDIKLNQYNNTQNTALLQELPFTITNSSGLMSSYSCTLKNTFNIVQCYSYQNITNNLVVTYDVCKIFINSLNKWTLPIYICDDCYLNSVDCLNDDTVFITFMDDGISIKYSLLSSNGSYVIHNESLYKFNSSVTSALTSSVTISNFSVNNINTTNTFHIVMEYIDYSDITNSHISMYAISGYYLSSDKSVVISSELTEIASLTDSVAGYLYYSISLKINPHCCLVISLFKANDMNKEHFKTVIVDSESNIVGDGDLVFHIVPNREEIQFIELSMLNNDDDDMHFAIIGNQYIYNETNRFYYYEGLFIDVYSLIDFGNGSYHVESKHTTNIDGILYTELVTNGSNQNVNNGHQFNAFNSYIIIDSSLLFVNWMDACCEWLAIRNSNM